MAYAFSWKLNVVTSGEESWVGELCVCPKFTFTRFSGCGMDVLGILSFLG